MSSLDLREKKEAHKAATCVCVCVCVCVRAIVYINGYHVVPGPSPVRETTRGIKALTLGNRQKMVADCEDVSQCRIVRKGWEWARPFFFFFFFYLMQYQL